MAKRVRSAKGEIIDFDLLKIKEQIAAAPETLEVRTRQDFIERKLRRRMKVAPKLNMPPKEIQSPPVEKVVEVNTETGEQTVIEIDKDKRTKQKARPQKED